MAILRSSYLRSSARHSKEVESRQRDELLLGAAQALAAPRHPRPPPIVENLEEFAVNLQDPYRFRGAYRRSSIRAFGRTDVEK